MSTALSSVLTIALGETLAIRNGSTLELRTYLQDTQDLVSGNDLDLCDSMAIPKHNTNLGWSSTLLRKFADLVDDLVWGGLQPGGRTEHRRSVSRPGSYGEDDTYVREYGMAEALMPLPLLCVVVNKVAPPYEL